MRLRVFGLVIACAACGAKKQDGSNAAPEKIRVQFGDCASVAVPFVSGPRPLPFELAEQTADATFGDGNPPVAKDEAALRKLPPDYVTTGAFASLVGTGLGSGSGDAIYGGLLGTESGEKSDGFGSGGATGWGTIGTGRYGTIGHGAGTGTRPGYGIGGGGHRRAGAVPTVAIGQPNANGDLDKTIIRRYIRRNINKIQYCYEKQLLVKPGLKGTVATTFFISPNGTVVRSDASGMDDEVAQCVAGVIKDIEFPKPKGGGGVQVNYPFTFRPAGDDGTGSGSGTGSDRAPGQSKLQKPDAALAKPTTYEPGATNPLRDQEQALVECFRALGKPWGVIVVDLAYDAAGGVTTATPHGIAEATFTTCVTTAAKKAKRTDKTVASQRCGIAFGTMPAAEIPTIAITATDVTWNGASVGRVKDIVADEQQGWKIAALFDALDTWAQQDAKAEVRVRGPGLIEPLDATPMKVVMRTLVTSWATNTPFVLAAQRGGTWQPLRAVTPPVVPVPIGTGGSWIAETRGRSSNAAVASDAPAARVSVSATGVVISARDETVATVAGRAWDAVDAALKQLKQSAQFVDRQDISISATGDVVYSDMVKTIDAATRAGFTEWHVVPAPPN